MQLSLRPICYMYIYLLHGKMIYRDSENVSDEIKHCTEFYLRRSALSSPTSYLGGVKSMLFGCQSNQGDAGKRQE